MPGHDPADVNNLLGAVPATSRTEVSGALYRQRQAQGFARALIPTIVRPQSCDHRDSKPRERDAGGCRVGLKHATATFAAEVARESAQPYCTDNDDESHAEHLQANI